MDIIIKIVVFLVFGLSAVYCALYVCRPYLKHYADPQKRLIDVLDSRFIPKVGTVAVLLVGGEKYLVVSGQNAVAISPLLATTTKNVGLD